MGDYRKTFSAQAVNRPRLEVLSSLVKFPEYLSLIPKEFNSLENQIEVPENSEITFQGKANRKLSQILITDSSSKNGVNPFFKDFVLKLPKIKEDKRYLLHIVDHFGFFSEGTFKYFP